MLHYSLLLPKGVRKIFILLLPGLSAGTLAVGGGNIRSNADVAHVAGSLIRSALPMHYHITVNGGRI